MTMPPASNKTLLDPLHRKKSKSIGVTPMPTESGNASSPLHYAVERPRQLQYRYFWNMSENATDFDEQNLVKAQDVSVDAVVTSLYFNALAFIALMVCYECLRRMMPSVYSSRKRLKYAREGHTNSSKANQKPQPSQLPESQPQSIPDMADDDDDRSNANSVGTLPDERPLDWVGPVFGVPWNQVRKTAGLDGYFFLRFIRMNVRIAAVSSFWFFAILVPVYATGTADQSQSARGWYHLSAANISPHGWRMWISVLFLYLFSGFILFVVKQEYRHFLELRQDFLARGSIHVHPQHHYSLMVENIPYALRSDRALADYFNQLFPGAVHSASVVLKLPDLEKASARCMRSCRRLEKSIAYLHATHHRPTHTVGRGRCSVLGVDWAPLECSRPGCSGNDSWLDDNADSDDDEAHAVSTAVSAYAELSSPGDPKTTTLPPARRVFPHRFQKDQQQQRPAKGTRIDSIQYYTQELAAHSRALFRLQKHKGAISESGNHSMKAEHWLDHVVREASIVAEQIMDESVMDNALISPTQSYSGGGPTPNHFAERMSSSNYGSINSTLSFLPMHNHPGLTVQGGLATASSQKKRRMLDDDSVVRDDSNPCMTDHS